MRRRSTRSFGPPFGPPFGSLVRTGAITSREAPRDARGSDDTLDRHVDALSEAAP